MSFEQKTTQDEVVKAPTKAVDFTQLVADSHLTKEEIRTVTEAYEQDKLGLLAATRWELRNFILQDYGAANYEALGGKEGIVRLQTALNERSGSAKITVDGYFGPETFLALIEFQNKNSIKPIDAIAGPITQAKLGITPVAWGSPEGAGAKRVKDRKAPLDNRPETVVFTERDLAKYKALTAGIETQIKEINDAKSESTGVIWGIGDWIGEKTGQFETGKQIYERQIQQVQTRAKELHAKILAEFQDMPLDEKWATEVNAIIERLAKVSGVKLAEVSWGKAVFNSVGVGDIKWDSGSLTNRTKIFAKTTIGLAEGAYETVSSIAEITGKAVGIVAAYAASGISEWKFDSSVWKQMASDVREIFSKLTLENAKQVLAMLPEALDRFLNASPDVQSEGLGKFIGAMLVPMGIGAKAIQSGKAVVGTGMVVARSWGRTIVESGAKAISEVRTTGTLSLETAKSATKWMAEWAAKIAEGGAEVAAGSATVAAWGAARLAEGDVIPSKRTKKPKQPEQPKPQPEAGPLPKVFRLSPDQIVTDADFKKAYRKIAMHYHPDRNAHPDTEIIFKEMKESFEYRDRSRFIRVVNDPDGYVQELRTAKKQNTPNAKESKPDFYTFSDGSTVQPGSAFDAWGNWSGAIRRPDWSELRGTFQSGELLQGTLTKNGERFIVTRDANIPIMRESDVRTSIDIRDGNSILGRLPTMKWTHRTTVDVLEKILDSGIIGSNSPRGVNFWGWLGAGYWDISLVMKRWVEHVSAAEQVAWSRVSWTKGMTYFFEESAGVGMKMDEYSRKFWDFTESRVRRGENPHLTDPYLMVGEKGKTFSHEVNADLIEAVILPQHVKDYPNYPSIKAWLEARGIRIVEAQTSPSVLRYAGGSILNVVAGWKNAKGAYAEAVRNALRERYPNLALHDAAIQYMKDTDLLPKNHSKSFAETLKQGNEIAQKNGLSRGDLRGGEFENYASQKNHTREQQAYFDYLLEAKYHNLAEMPPKELASLLEWYLAMPELLARKGVSPQEIQKLIQDLNSASDRFNSITRKHSAYEWILSKLAA